ncbi:MAG: glycosyltransferase [Clostridia bacterium]|nr:glycosyltransferase [Clostridia bacterium]
MIRTAVIGHFGGNKEFLDGQTVKTKSVTAALEKEFGENEVLKIDTYGGKNFLLKLPFFSRLALKQCENVVILPAHNSLRIVPALLQFLNRFYKRRIHYVVIGGWLAAFLKNKKSLTNTLRKLDGIYVETSTMKRSLEEMGFENVRVMPNFKELTPLSEKELVYAQTEPYKLCTFSRVMKEKGIEDAITAVKRVNEHYGRTVYTLDIFGQIDVSQIEWFQNLQKEFTGFVSYRGIVEYDKSVEVLKDYFALLFPTRFYTEGIPGTLIDAYSAGVPVITSLWLNYSDVFSENVTGWGYEFENVDALTDLLKKVAENPDEFLKMKSSALFEAQKFKSDVAIKVLIDRM